MSPSETTPLLATDTTAPARPTISPSEREDCNAVQIEVQGSAHALPGPTIPTPRLNQLVTPQKRAAILAAVWTGVFLGALDSTIVATLMSSISSSFDASNQLSWLASAYLLSTSATGALYGKLADLLGRRMSNLIALGFFTLGTLGCGLSSNMSQLIFSRFLAGCGGGGIMTTSSIIATDLFRLDQRGLVQGFANICFGLGAALGGPLGGWIADTMGWRFAFLAQVPLLIIATILVASFVDYKLEGQVTSKAELARRIDYRGSIALVWMIGALLLSLSFKSNLQYEWTDPRVYGNFIGFLLGLAVFIYIESSVPEPVLPLRLLKFRTPLCSVGISFFTSMIVFSVLYMYPLWFETVKLSSPTEAGLHLIPNSVALSVGSLAAGGWILKTGQHKMVIFISSALLLLGSLLMLFKLDSPLHEWIDIIPNGLGFSASTTAVLISLIASVPEKDMAVCTGLSYLFRYNGVVIGVAASGAILQSVLTTELKHRIVGEGATELIERIRHESTLVKSLPEGIWKQGAIESYKLALKSVFKFNLLLSLISFFLSFGIENNSLDR
ncbi:hypothetical protein PGT21_033475 [Puccinia graminis f. sp. tritici]|uniref:Major facilitator superfamily (MFS) profile domain-containing protein n=1 Tax=Puccinia graminis f. sp. tritici TaxID=56615 RepID=A0A5B0NI55_PUCGR|nr:hypothetical protein PGT21_033475 [Puccinia graminis f. sp. tritici]